MLAGCGFQLQGAFTPPPGMERTYIEAADRHSLLYRELRIAMQEAGMQLVDDPASATATLNLSYDETDQRVLSVSARNVPTEYEVYYTIEYSLYAGQQTMLEMQSLTLTRDYNYDPTLVLGKAREEELLRAAIVDDIVRIILKQISAL
jgi:LPS-assembly lipoprotein